MCGGAWGEDSLEKGKYLANSYTVAFQLKNVVKLQVTQFFSNVILQVEQILMVVCSFWIFSQESFLERGLHISMNGGLVFIGGFVFGWRGYPAEVAPALMVKHVQKISWSGRNANHASPH